MTGIKPDFKYEPPIINFSAGFGGYYYGRKREVLMFIAGEYLYYNYGYRDGHCCRRKSTPLYGFVFIFLIVSLFSLIPLSANESSASFLNQEEKVWLEQLDRPLRVGVTQIPNQMLVSKNGTYRGFSIDLFQMIGERLGIGFDYIYFKSWGSLIEAARKRQIDIVFLLQKTPLRHSYLDFTDTVVSQQNKIIVDVKKDTNGITIEALRGRKVAVTQGSAIEEYLKTTYPDILLIPVKTELEVLTSVADGSVDAAISESVRASYYIEQYDLNSLHIAGDLGYDYHLSIGSRNDLPILSVILSKTVTNIPVNQFEALRLKWGYTKDKVVFFDSQTMIYIGIVFGIIFGIILPFSLYLYFVNRHLQREIEARKQALEELQAAHDAIHELKLLAESEARTDELTKIPNRRGIQEFLISEIVEYRQHKTPFSLLLVDIDHFKKINDKMGHDVGDQVLETFAKLVKKCLRPYDRFGRIGGEEFALIFPHTTADNAVGIAERIRETVKHYTYHIDTYVFGMTISGGVTEVITSDTPDSIIKRADILLYRSKVEGRDRISI